jgi:hypothetical protein
MTTLCKRYNSQGNSMGFHNNTLSLKENMGTCCASSMYVQCPYMWPSKLLHRPDSVRMKLPSQLFISNIWADNTVSRWRLRPPRLKPPYSFSWHHNWCRSRNCMYSTSHTKSKNILETNSQLEIIEYIVQLFETILCGANVRKWGIQYNLSVVTTTKMMTMNIISFPQRPPAILNDEVLDK